jgi:hypothetical protein
VVARKSNGVVEAQKFFQGRIATYSNVDEAVKLIKNRLGKIREPLDSKIQALQVKRDADGLERLFDSWLAN